MSLVSSYISKAGIDIIRSSVDEKVFNVHDLVNYIENHDVITKEIFYIMGIYDNFKKDQSRYYLNYYQDLPRNIFIQRIPIYFYDYNHYKKECTIKEFFESYFERVYEGNDYDNIENIMWKLEKMLHYYEITLDEIFRYLINQGGIENLCYTFEKWFEYLELIGRNKEIYRPQNILTGLNNELRIRKGLEYIYSPEIIRIEKYYNYVSIIGLFPTDNDGTIIFDWVGIWRINTLEMSSLTRNHYSVVRSQRRLVKQNQPIMINEVRIEVNDDSEIFILKDEYQNGISMPVWYSIYTGLNKLEFDYTLISYYREQQRINQKVMCYDLNISLRTFQRFEAGETRPDALDFIKIMEYLNIRDYKKFIKKKRIEDPNFEKFLSWKEGLRRKE